MESVKILYENNTPRCKYCFSTHIIRYGIQKNIQRWWCKDCQRKFIDNNALPRMRTSIDQIAKALSEFYNGSSLISIRRNLQIQYNIYPSESTIYRWVTKFSKTAITEANKTKINVGETWIAYENIVRISGTRYYLVDLFDKDTRFLLATKLFYDYNLRDIQNLIKDVEGRAGKKQKQVIMDRWEGSTGQVEFKISPDSGCLVRTPVDEVRKMNLLKFWYESTIGRTEAIGVLKTRETAQLVTDGWSVHYNYFKPHKSLNYLTPAQAAKAQFNYLNWLDVIVKSSPLISDLSSSSYTGSCMQVAAV